MRTTLGAGCTPPGCLLTHYKMMRPPIHACRCRTCTSVVLTNSELVRQEVIAVILVEPAQVQKRAVRWLLKQI